jgi:nitroreductase
MQRKLAFFSIASLLSSIAFYIHAQENEMCTRKPAQQSTSDIFSSRRSYYAMSGQALTDQELQTLFEAARWAPSSYNAQPWRFLYAKRGTKHWDTYFNLLVDFNKKWAANADVLLVIVSNNNFEHNGKSSITHSFDAGAAWQNLALQAHMMGLVAHGMEGFDYAQAKKALSIPDGYSVEAMAALGKRGTKKNLPLDIQNIEDKASGRKAVGEFAFNGTWPKGKK